MCIKCQLHFPTRNLHDWHDCYIRNNGNCLRCNRKFLKKTTLFKHSVQCTGTGNFSIPLPSISESKVIQKPATVKKTPSTNWNTTLNLNPIVALEPITPRIINNSIVESLVKSEPEAILDGDVVNNAEETNDHVENKADDDEDNDDNDGSDSSDGNMNDLSMPVDDRYSDSDSDDEQAPTSIVAPESTVTIDSVPAAAAIINSVVETTVNTMGDQVTVKTEPVEDDDDDVIIIEDEIAPPIVIGADNSPTKKKDKKSKKHKKDKRQTIEKLPLLVAIKQEPADEPSDQVVTEPPTCFDLNIQIKSEPGSTSTVVPNELLTQKDQQIITSLHNKKRDKKSKHKHKKDKRSDISVANAPVSIKQEPIDNTELDTQPSIVQPQLATVQHALVTFPSQVAVSTPPQQINVQPVSIKKEPLDSGYADFDPNVAQNIKKEPVDINAKQPPLRLKITKEHGTLNAKIIPDKKSANKNSAKAAPKRVNKPKNVYKKPALLAEKIRQEMLLRMAREREATTPNVTIPVIAQVSSGDGTTQITSDHQMPVISNVATTSLDPFPLSAVKIECQSAEEESQSDDNSDSDENADTENSDYNTHILPPTNSISNTDHNEQDNVEHSLLKNYDPTTDNTEDLGNSIMETNADNSKESTNTYELNENTAHNDNLSSNHSNDSGNIANNKESNLVDSLNVNVIAEQLISSIADSSKLNEECLSATENVPAISEEEVTLKNDIIENIMTPAVNADGSVDDVDRKSSNIEQKNGSDALSVNDNSSEASSLSVSLNKHFTLESDEQFENSNNVHNTNSTSESEHINDIKSDLFDNHINVDQQEMQTEKECIRIDNENSNNPTSDLLMDTHLTAIVSTDHIPPAEDKVLEQLSLLSGIDELAAHSSLEPTLDKSEHLDMDKCTNNSYNELQTVESQVFDFDNALSVLTETDNKLPALTDSIFHNVATAGTNFAEGKIDNIAEPVLDPVDMITFNQYQNIGEASTTGQTNLDINVQPNEIGNFLD